MLLKDLFTPADVVVDFDPGDKWEAIGQLFDHLARSGRISAERASALQEQVLERERSKSTGMEAGVAIPHAAVDELERVVACIGTVRREGGLSFDSLDGRPTHIVVLLLIPRSQRLLHIRTLADVGRVLGKDSVRQALLAAKTPEEAWNALAEGE